MRSEVAVELEFLTPAFLSRGDNTRPEFRVPSFKGVLRYWWRALAWSRMGGDLEAIRTREATLFGSAHSGRGRFSMRAAGADPSEWPGTDDAGLVYLAGQGLMNFRGELRRRAIAPGHRVSLSMRFDRRADETDRSEIKDALSAAAAFGGLGARSRRGFGSFMVHGEAWVNHVGSFASGCRQLMDAKESGFPGYSAFSGDTRAVIVWRKGAQPLEVLSEVGKEFVRFRSNGSSHMRGQNALREDAEPTFRQDHDSIAAFISNNDVPDNAPERAVFGLPHNYFFSSLRNSKAEVEPEGRDRRASPLFISAGRHGDDASVLITLLKSTFLESQKVTLSHRHHTGVVDLPENLWSPADRFLDRLFDRTACKAAFTGREAMP